MTLIVIRGINQVALFDRGWLYASGHKPERHLQVEPELHGHPGRSPVVLTFPQLEAFPGLRCSIGTFSSCSLYVVQDAVLKEYSICSPGYTLPPIPSLPSSGLRGATLGRVHNIQSSLA
jgi:hypothetical protein